jgi:hypothetical protein
VSDGTAGTPCWASDYENNRQLPCRDHSEFITPHQQARLQSAFEAMAEQYVHQTFDDLIGAHWEQPPPGARRGNLIFIE